VTGRHPATVDHANQLEHDQPKSTSRVAEEVGPAQILNGPSRSHNGARANGRAARHSGRSQQQADSALVLRADRPPVDRLDFDDRHHTRATQNAKSAKLYVFLNQDIRRGEWHQLIMTLVCFVVLVALYLGGFVALSRLLPTLGPVHVTHIVTLAFIAAGGGVGARSAGRALKKRYGRRPPGSFDSTDPGSG